MHSLLSNTTSLSINQISQFSSELETITAVKMLSVFTWLLLFTSKTDGGQ